MPLPQNIHSSYLLNTPIQKSLSNFEIQISTTINLYNNYSDEQIWKGVQAGDAGMFKELYQRYIMQMSNQAYKLLADEEQTKDLMQEVFLNLYQQRNNLPADLNAGAYLTTTVKNKSLNLLRDIKVKQHHQQMIKEIQEHAKPASPFEVSELRMQLNTSLDTLKGKSKEVFFMRHYENKSHKEISAHLGISSKTVEKHVSRAMQQLKEQMGAEWTE